MKLIIRIFLFCTLSSLAIASFGQKSKKTIFFYEIDDMAKISVNGKKVYQSENLGHLGEVKIEVDISKYIITGDEKITIELVNVKCADCTGSNPWGINFEIFEDGEEMDYQYGKGEGQENLKAVFSYSFYWNDL